MIVVALSIAPLGCQQSRPTLSFGDFKTAGLGPILRVRSPSLCSSELAPFACSGRHSPFWHELPESSKSTIRHPLPTCQSAAIVAYCEPDVETRSSVTVG